MALATVSPLNRSKTRLPLLMTAPVPSVPVRAAVVPLPICNVPPLIVVVPL
jgi:hypothetical protein